MRSRPARPDRRGAGRDGVDSRESASSDDLPSGTRKLRCAVYTRKSSEEGLDMEFNTLDAQREACEAYVVSQRAEGWLPGRGSLRRCWSLRRHAGAPCP